MGLAFRYPLKPLFTSRSRPIILSQEKRPLSIWLFDVYEQEDGQPIRLFIRSLFYVQKNSAFDLAAKNGHLEIVEYLLEREGDLLYSRDKTKVNLWKGL